MSDLEDIEPSDYDQLIQWASQHPPEGRTEEQEEMLRHKVRQAWNRRRAVYHAKNRVGSQN